MYICCVGGNFTKQIMKTKDLLRILFRLFGLYTFLKLLFEFLPQQISYILNAKIFFPFDEKTVIYQTYIYISIVIFFMVLVFYILIINPEIIIRNLKPKEFLENEINFSNINTLTMIKIAILSLGVLILFNSIPNLINGLFLYFKLNQMSEKGVDNINTVNSKVDLIMNGFTTFFGLLLLIFNGQIGKYLYKSNVVE